MATSTCLLFKYQIVQCIVIFMTHQSNGSTWCYACNSAQDIKCYDPANAFYSAPDDLVAFVSNSSSKFSGVFSFTSSSYLKTSANGSQTMQFVETGTKMDYCTNHTYSRWHKSSNQSGSSFLNFTSCRYRPAGLRLVNCDTLLADQPGTKQCFKIKQIAGMRNTETVENIIRTCISRPVEVANDTCQRTVSLDGKTETVWCTCSDTLCNSASTIKCKSMGPTTCFMLFFGLLVCFLVYLAK
ncbi:uncharacterized protein LOC129590238 isoform X2 [Paramacrobiotus metropolitanus]|uniref:uncharacterized protein LOC129590238 isoform X2 n=1 Tax=Paramacrobiotus metropolitanus TaxID=2943436 RepID=UPI0024457CE4|nr:uncharacterized protein LOC129590238 isoform X2 [Paramacrobiotus metropolitanus]